MPIDEELLDQNAYTRSVGIRVKRCRVAAEMDQADLAKKSGVSQPTISRIENGAGYLDGGVVMQLARALGVSAETLLGSNLLGDEVAAAARPGADTSAMEAMLDVARDYLANLRRVATI